MAEITWTAEAQRWLQDIFEYIAADNPDAAIRTVNGIYERTQVLATFPGLGHRYWASSRHVGFYSTAIIASLILSRTTETSMS
jgi:plasmid stabilization system protein ParE